MRVRIRVGLVISLLLTMTISINYVSVAGVLKIQSLDSDTKLSNGYDSNPQNNNVPRLDYVARDSIYIDSDDDFVTLGFLGSGTEDDPYIIQGYNITPSGYRSYGIHIESVTKFFIIKDCYISSSNIHISDIYIYNVMEGIATIANNYLATHGDTGIYVSNSNNVTIANNTIVDKITSIEISNSNGAIIINNTLQHASYGLYLSKAPYTQLINNTLIDQYLEFDFGDDHNFATITAENNTVNGKKILFLTFKDNFTINSSQQIGQLFLVNCSNVLISDQFLSDLCQMLYIIMSDNITIRNVTLARNQYYYGLYFHYGNNILLENCTFSSNGIGTALISEVNNLTITNCVFENNGDTFAINSAATIVISNNTIKNSGLSLVQVSTSIIKYNLFIDSGTAIRLQDSSSCNVYYNIFVESHGYDNSGGNIWYNATTKKGNSWSDWTYGPYLIEGPGNAEDKYPTSDFDEDGIKDEFEVKQYSTDPFNPDTDGDGLRDENELLFGTDPINPDTDADGLNDTCEVYITGTNPRVADTDGDGLNDGEEVNVFNTNPFDTDTDSDGLKDGEEVNNYKTDPNNVDTDGDNCTDYEEIKAGTDPLDPNSYPVFTETTNTSINDNTTNSEMLNIFGYNISKAPDLYGIISLILSGLALLGVFILLIRNIKKAKRK